MKTLFTGASSRLGSGPYLVALTWYKNGIPLTSSSVSVPESIVSPACEAVPIILATSINVEDNDMSIYSVVAFYRSPEGTLEEEKNLVVEEITVPVREREPVH